MDLLLQTVGGPGYRRVLDMALPGAFDHAVASADVFQVEMPNVQRRSLGPSDAERVAQPVLNILGANSVKRVVEGADLVQRWFPASERLLLPRTGHLMMLESSEALADAVGTFFALHPPGAMATSRAGVT